MVATVCLRLDAAKLVMNQTCPHICLLTPNSLFFCMVSLDWTQLHREGKLEKQNVHTVEEVWGNRTPEDCIRYAQINEVQARNS